MNFGLYIHWPFCIKKCPYCDFNSYALKYEEEQWINGLLEEIEAQGKTFKQYKIETIFFGGGTPSLIRPENIKRLIEKAFHTWPKAKENVEITIEVNPSSIETHKLEKFLASGITRFSIGIQALDDTDLKFLGRIHSSAEAIEVLAQASKICDFVSADFIYSLPNETLHGWQKKLERIISLIKNFNIKHSSLYQLVIEENTNFFEDVAKNRWQPMHDDLQSKLYEYTKNELSKINWQFYETSSACLNDEFHKWQCQHNLIYWNYRNYLGIGPGAHSRMEDLGNKIKFNNYKNPNKWLNQNKMHYKEKEDYAILNEQEQFKEKIIMGLRLAKGINLNENEKKFLNKTMINVLQQHEIIYYDNNKIYVLNGHTLKINSIIKAITNSEL